MGAGRTSSATGNGQQCSTARGQTHRSEVWLWDGAPCHFRAAATGALGLLLLPDAGELVTVERLGEIRRVQAERPGIVRRRLLSDHAPPAVRPLPSTPHQRRHAGGDPLVAPALSWQWVEHRRHSGIHA